MVVIFSTVVIDPTRHDELVSAVGSWLARSVEARSGALTYEFLVNPADPSRLHFFQAWPDKDTFDRWLASEVHQESVFRRHGTSLDSWGVVFEGCTDTTTIRPQSR